MRTKKAGTTSLTIQEFAFWMPQPTLATTTRFDNAGRFELSRRLCLGRIFLGVPGVPGGPSLLALFHVPGAELTDQLDQNPMPVST